MSASRNWNITVKRTTWTYVIVPGCVRSRRVVWFSIGKKRKRAEERNWKTTNLTFWPRHFNGTLGMKLSWWTLRSIHFFFLDVFRFDQLWTCENNSLLFGLFSGNDLKWKWAYPFHLKSFSLRRDLLFDSISTNDFFRCTFLSYLTLLWISRGKMNSIVKDWESIMSFCISAGYDRLTAWFNAVHVLPQNANGRKSVLFHGSFLPFDTSMNDTQFFICFSIN